MGYYVITLGTGRLRFGQIRSPSSHHLAELHNLAFTLELSARYGIAGLDDYDKRISSLEFKQKQASDPKQKERIAVRISQLEQASDFVREKELLPQKRPPKPKQQLTPAQKKVAAQRNQASYSYGDARHIDRGYDQPSRDGRVR